MVTKIKETRQMVYFRVNPKLYAKFKAEACLKGITVQKYFENLLIKELYK